MARTAQNCSVTLRIYHHTHWSECGQFLTEILQNFSHYLQRAETNNTKFKTKLKMNPCLGDYCDISADTNELSSWIFFSLEKDKKGEKKQLRCPLYVVKFSSTDVLFVFALSARIQDWCYSKWVFIELHKYTWAVCGLLYWYHNEL